jgi:hypothetical protein
VGSIVIIDNPNDDVLPFWTGEVVTRNAEIITVQWLGNRFGRILGSFRPAWRDDRGDHFFSAKSGGHARPYLNTMDDVELSTSMVICHSFALRNDDKLPMMVIKLLSASPRIFWSYYEVEKSKKCEAHEDKNAEEVKESEDGGTPLAPPPLPPVATMDSEEEEKSGAEEALEEKVSSRPPPQGPGVTKWPQDRLGRSKRVKRKPWKLLLAPILLVDRVTFG